MTTKARTKKNDDHTTKAVAHHTERRAKREFPASFPAGNSEKAATQRLQSIIQSKKPNHTLHSHFTGTQNSTKQGLPPASILKGKVIQKKISVGDEEYDSKSAFNELVLMRRMFSDSMNSRLITIIKIILNTYDRKNLPFHDIDDFSMQLNRDVERAINDNYSDIGLPEIQYDVDESGSEGSIEDSQESVFSEDEGFSEMEPEPEEPIFSEYNLDSQYLYRAKDVPKEKTVTKENMALRGFFSTSLDYARQFYKDGPKGDYDTMIRITLSKPIGNILVDLIRSSDAFKQNAGEVGNLLDETTGIKATQNRVTSKRRRQGILEKKGKLTADYRDGKGRSRNVRGNAPNAVMIKQEPLEDIPVTNIEITSRITKEGVLVEHPLDKYVTNVERYVID